ncbi:MAG: hypothetical protein DMG57_37355 [Acidobacteria bacterium]|nr:MAG: hypothetical protein DMG57_37355 [Acidobacteriota bacterium]
MAGRQGFLPKPSANPFTIQHNACKPLKPGGLPESISSRLSLLLFAILPRTDTKTDTMLAERLEIEAKTQFITTLDFAPQRVL